MVGLPSAPSKESGFLMGRTLFLPTSLKIVAAVGVAFVLWGLVLASPAHAAILTVTNTNDAGAGSLRQAIIDANAAAGADTINLPSGTYLLSSQLPTITSPVTIDGDSPNPTIDGGTSVRLFFVASGAQLSLNELTLTQGKTASNDGGAIRNEGTLVVANSIFSGNTSNNQGGGIFSTGTLEVSDSTFSGNSANLDGGAITSHGNGTATVTNSTFSKNSAQQGGAISNQHTLEVTNSTFSDNKTHR